MANANGRKNIDWKPIIEKVKKELQAYKTEGFSTPPLRSMFYRLASKNIIPNTKTGYRGLMEHCTRWRWNRTLDMHCFADETRRIIKGFEDEYKTPEQIIDSHVKGIKDVLNNYSDTVPRWRNQKHYVELWTEKKAMINNLVPILEDRDVTIVPISGFNSTPFLSQSYWRLYGQVIKGKKVHVVYFGDFDPSGEEISSDSSKRLHRCMNRFGRHFEIDFQRIAVTPKQVTDYNLPQSLDDPTRDKLEQDPRADKFRAKHGGLYQVELDALPALIPNQFREMITDSVDQFFDERIHKKMLKEIKKNYSPDKIEEIVKNAIIKEAQKYTDTDVDKNKKKKYQISNDLEN